MKKKLVIALFLLVCLSSLFAQTDYYIDQYNISIEVGRNNVYSVTENLTFYYNGPHHGFYREIPYDYTSYNGRMAKISKVTCSDEYSDYTSDGYYIMQIGSEDKTYSGYKDYTITFNYAMYADLNDGYDEFYYNIIGSGWECPIKNVSFSITFPAADGYDMKSIISDNLWFTSGSYGSTSKKGVTYTITQNPDSSVTISGTCSSLNAYEALTVRVQLPEDWYVDAHTPWDFRVAFKVITPLLTVVLLVLAILVWQLNGRDPIPIITARFEAPDGLSPLLVGYLYDKSADDKDVISMLFYWADKGLLTINEDGKDEFTFTKLKDIEAYAIEKGENIPAVETQLFNDFFKGCSVGDTVTFKTLEKNNFYEKMLWAKSGAAKYFRKDKRLTEKKSVGLSTLFYFVAAVPILLLFCRLALCQFPDEAAALVVLMAFAIPLFNAVVFSNLFRKWYIRKTNFFAIVLCLIPSAIGFVFTYADANYILGSEALVQTLVAVLGSAGLSLVASILPKRSEYANKMLEQILGYKEFIEKVELSVLQLLIKDDPMLYYHTLSYAIVLGLEDKWAKKFEGIAIPPVYWYRGPSALDAYYLSRMTSRMYRALPAAIIPKTSSKGNPGLHVGGGGFGSGGFSGGGFGGGGGRAW